MKRRVVFPGAMFFFADAGCAQSLPGGVEDLRIVEREDGAYVLTSAQWNRVTYSVVEALFDANQRARLVTQLPNPVLKAELRYEKTGRYAAVATVPVATEKQGTGQARVNSGGSMRGAGK